MLFTIPPDGSKIFLKETIPGHQHGITGLASNRERFISSDTIGTIIIWNIETMLQVNVVQPTFHSGITSLGLRDDTIMAANANGMIRFFDVSNGQIAGSIAAHSRCINAMDYNDEGLVATVSDDCYLRVWKISDDIENFEVNLIEVLLRNL